MGRQGGILKCFSKGAGLRLWKTAEPLGGALLQKSL